MSYRFFLGSLCSAWMIGIGTRFLIDGYLKQNIFGVNHFDAIFDWGVLFVLGVLLLCYFVLTEVKSKELKNNE
jgi:hypothetical protein